MHIQACRHVRSRRDLFIRRAVAPRTWKYRTTLGCCRRDSVATSRVMRAKEAGEALSSLIFFTAYARPSSLSAQ